MLENCPERPQNEVLPGQLATELAEITHINSEFLRLVVHPGAASGCDFFGLDTGTVAALRATPPEQLHLLAAVPQVLAEFSELPGSSSCAGVADTERLMQKQSQWERELQDFATRLLTCLWQTARRNAMLTTLTAGLPSVDCERLAQQSFSSLSRCSAVVTTSLRARFANHPRFWPDLIRAAHSGDDARQTVSRLAVVQLSVSQKGLEQKNRRANRGNAVVPPL